MMKWSQSIDEHLILWFIWKIQNQQNLYRDKVIVTTFFGLWTLKCIVCKCTNVKLKVQKKGQIMFSGFYKTFQMCIVENHLMTAFNT